MDGELATGIDTYLSAVHTVHAQAATHHAGGAAVVVRCQKGEGGTLTGRCATPIKRSLPPRVESAKTGFPPSVAAKFDGRRGNQIDGGFGEGGVRVFPEPRTEPGGQQLLECGGAL